MALWDESILVVECSCSGLFPLDRLISKVKAGKRVSQKP